ncbi:MAG: DUF4294 domain-containing protein [Saprospiraceae bacterium]
MRTSVLLFIMFFAVQLFAQKEKKETVRIDGHLLTMWITESGDTLLIANLDEMSVSSPRKFRTDQERLLYERYRRYAIKVYPYAVEAIKVFREVEYFTQDMNRRDKKKRIKKLQDDLEREFEEPLKKLTKTQGYVLMKMIERELDTPMYDLVKNLRGGFTATYWSTMGWFYGHHLGEGYHVGEDPILDIVLDDFDISYSLPRNYKEDNFEDHFFEKEEKKKEDQKSKKN